MPKFTDTHDGTKYMIQCVKCDEVTVEANLLTHECNSLSTEDLSLKFNDKEWFIIKHALETYTACNWGSPTAKAVDGLIETIGTQLAKNIGSRSTIVKGK
jgi:hypothetical protein